MNTPTKIAANWATTQAREAADALERARVAQKEDDPYAILRNAKEAHEAAARAHRFSACLYENEAREQARIASAHACSASRLCAGYCPSMMYKLITQAAEHAVATAVACSVGDGDHTRSAQLVAEAAAQAHDAAAKLIDTMASEIER